MPERHSLLGPSKAKQWLYCTPSIRLEENFPVSESSDAANEGTLAHSFAEQKLTKWINRKRNKIICEDKDMDTYTDDYRDYVVEVYNKVKKACKDPVILVEQWLDLSDWLVEKNSGGTADAIIIGDDTLHIIDLKYGKGVAVSAYDNPQLKLYALGAVKEYSMLYDFTKVDMHIFQPRIGGASDEIISVNDLISWGDTVVKPAAELAYAGEGDYNPSEDTCRWCRAKAVCKARAEKNMMLEKYGFIDADLLTNQEISDVLKAVDEMTRWASDVKEFALDQMLKGVHYDGFKVVEGRSIRKVIDELKLVKNMKAEGVEEALMYEKKLNAISKLEKLVGKKKFAEISVGSVEKPAGSPTIAPLNDKRPEYNSGVADFQEELQAIPS